MIKDAAFQERQLPFDNWKNKKLRAQSHICYFKVLGFGKYPRLSNEGIIMKDYILSASMWEKGVRKSIFTLERLTTIVNSYKGDTKSVYPALPFSISI